MSSLIFNISAGDSPGGISWQEAIQILDWKNVYGYQVHEIHAGYRHLDYASGNTKSISKQITKYYSITSNHDDSWFLFVFPDYRKSTEDLGKIVSGMKIEKIRGKVQK